MPSEPGVLNKHLFVRAAKCGRELWFGSHRPELAKAHDAGVLERMRVGKVIGELARTLHPDGVFVERAGVDAAAATLDYLRNGAQQLFEATFRHGDLLARVDILNRLPDGTYEIVEVKSSKLPSAGTAPKGSQIADLAFQVHVASLCGLTVSRAVLMLINPAFQHGDPLDSLLARLDVTDDVGKVLQKLPEQTERAVSILKLAEAPPPELIGHCRECGYRAECFGADDLSSILHIPSIRPPQLISFRDSGRTRIQDLSEVEVKDPKQKRAVRALREGRIVVESSLRSQLGNIRYPTVYVDFEAVSPAIPYYARTRPYQTLPFQWSAHFVERPGADPVHREFLHRSQDDPRESFVATLADAVEGAATILIYSPYETRRVHGLFREAVPGAEKLLERFDDPSRTIDMLDLVRDHVYAREFGGSFSIKAVLPALVPELGYSHLEIQDGETAAVKFLEMLDASTTEYADHIAQQLLLYCRQDTLAMVAIHQALIQLAVAQPAFAL